MAWYVVRLSFVSPLHVGRDNPGVGVEGVQTMVHSDTLFSAFCNAWADMGDEGNRALEQFASEREVYPIRLSSAFPFTSDDRGNLLYFFPLPLLPVVASFNCYGRLVRKAEFLETEGMYAWTRGWITDDSGIRGNNALARANLASCYVEQVRPRHSNDREKKSSDLYHCGETFFQEGSGLFLFAEADGPDFLRRTLDCLAERGLGGERSIGYGLFRPQVESLDAIEPLAQLRRVSGNAWVLISAFYPSSAEKPDIAATALAYRPVLRKGWFSYEQGQYQAKRATYRFFGEGSSFTREPRGCVLTVNPQTLPYRIYRSGLALSLPIRIESTHDA